MYFEIADFLMAPFVLLVAFLAGSGFRYVYHEIILEREKPDLRAVLMGSVGMGIVIFLGACLLFLAMLLWPITLIMILVILLLTVVHKISLKPFFTCHLFDD